MREQQEIRADREWGRHGVKGHRLGVEPVTAAGGLWSLVHGLPALTTELLGQPISSVELSVRL